MPSEAAGGCVIAKLFRLVTAELLERAVDEARLRTSLAGAATGRLPSFRRLLF